MRITAIGIDLARTVFQIAALSADLAPRQWIDRVGDLFELGRELPRVAKFAREDVRNAIFVLIFTAAISIVLIYNLTLD